MELTSVIHSGIKAPIKLDQVLLSISPISLSKRTKLHFSHLHNPTLSAVRSGRCRQVSPLGCSKGTEQEDVSASGTDCERTGSQSLIDIDNVSTSDTQYSVDSHGTKAEEQEIYSSSMRTVALWVSTAVAFGVGIGLKDGIGKASEFFAGYILEQSLSVDNLFVFVLVFKYFKVPLMYQSQVLSYGFAGAIIFRLSIILLGTATLQRFEAVNLVLAVILLFSSFKLFSSEEDDSDLSDNFIVKMCQKFIPVTANYDGNRFITKQDGIWKLSDDIARIYGLDEVMTGELVESKEVTIGITLNLESNNIGVVLMGDGLMIQKGSYVKATEKIAQILISEAYLNHVINALAKAIDGRGEVSAFEFWCLASFEIIISICQATPLLLTVAVIELSDIAFAVDSIPAVFGVTRDPFIVFTSNLFAILGLRSLYTLISEGMADLEYLQPSIGIVLGFIGCKMILDFFGFHVSTEASLGFVATSLTAGVLLSLMNKSDS